jgi:methylmalonyl-CoA mutase N-terminal domain/subunit
VAKFRAARRLWARREERFGPRTRVDAALRFHTQTGGSTLTAQQPSTTSVRVAVQALAAVLGGTQSLHTNGMDEALGCRRRLRRASRCDAADHRVRVGRRADSWARTRWAARPPSRR